MFHLMRRIQQHANVDMIYRSTPLQGTIADPNMPIVGIDFRSAGIMAVRVQQPPLATSTAPPPQEERAPDVPKKQALKPMDNPVMNAYKPPVRVNENQLDAILLAHDRKKASGEAYEKREIKSPWLKGLLERNAEKERKQRLKREARERKVDLKELKRRRAVTYVETGNELPVPVKVEPATEDESLENIDGVETDRPFLQERPETDEVVAEVLEKISTEKDSDSSIPLILPRRARPTLPESA